MCLLTFKRTEHLPAFTLAETLITLMILGVIAAMTISSLIENYQKHTCLAQLKKGISTVNQAIARARVDYGEISGWDEISSDKGHYLKDVNGMMQTYLIPNMNVMEFYPGNSMDTGNGNGICYDPDDTPVLGKNNTPYSWLNGIYMSTPFTGRTASMALTDGTCIAFTPVTGPNDVLDVIIDVNGSKKPPNKAGRDVFFFKLSKEGFMRPYGYDKSYAEVSGRGDSGCSKGSKGLYCTALIMFDGFQMKKGYPW